MPIIIYKVAATDAEHNERVALLCHGEWMLAPQIEELSLWLQQSATGLQQAKYVADVGFRWRRDASGGGPVLDPQMMRRMAELGMSLYLSEYGSFANEPDEE